MLRSILILVLATAIVSADTQSMPIMIASNMNTIKLKEDIFST